MNLLSLLWITTAGFADPSLLATPWNTLEQVGGRAQRPAFSEVLTDPSAYHFDLYLQQENRKQAVWSPYASGFVGNGGVGVKHDGQLVVIDLFQNGQPIKPWFGTEINASLASAKLARFAAQLEIPHELLLRKLTDIERRHPQMGRALIQIIQAYQWKTSSLRFLPNDFSWDGEVPHQATSFQIASREYNTIRVRTHYWKHMSAEQRVALVIHEAVTAMTFPPICRAQSLMICGWYPTRFSAGREIVRSFFSEHPEDVSALINSQLWLPETKTNCEFAPEQTTVTTARRKWTFKNPLSLSSYKRFAAAICATENFHEGVLDFTLYAQKSPLGVTRFYFREQNSIETAVRVSQIKSVLQAHFVSHHPEACTGRLTTILRAWYEINTPIGAEGSCALEVPRFEL